MEYTQMFKKWFSTATPLAGVKASINIGAGADGIVTTKSDLVGTEGNSYTITVSSSGANDCAMSASISGTDITVVLGKTVAALEPTKNTAILIATAIDALEGVNAIHSGTGATAIGAAIVTTNFTGGQYATPVNCACFIIISGVWYIADVPVTKWTLGGWTSATPS
jgi:hypothetical protein